MRLSTLFALFLLASAVVLIVVWWRAASSSSRTNPEQSHRRESLLRSRPIDLRDSIYNPKGFRKPRD
jgi:membrane protein implicated in regulation of membrane protease activity